MSCKKCRQCKPLPDDTWCLGCAAWESLETELKSPWSQAALRAAANDLVVDTVRAVRSLRSIASSLHSAENSSRAGAKAERGRSRSPQGTVRRLLPVPPPPPVPVKEQEESSESEDQLDSDEEEEVAPATTTAAKSDPARRPPEPKGPPPSREREEHRSGQSSGHHKSGKKKSKGGHHRGGKKHKRLYRQLENPDLVLHRSLPAAFWDQRSGRQGREALERRR